MSDSLEQNFEQLKKKLDEISTKLAAFAKKAPELVDYLKAHGHAIEQILQPVGFSYELINAQVTGRLFTKNIESLDFKNNPGQEEAFKKITVEVLRKKQPIVIEPGMLPTEGANSIQQGTPPAPHKLPPFNKTPFFQYFIPIVSEHTAIGVIQVWFEAATNMSLQQLRLEILQRFSLEALYYFKAKQNDQLSAELVRLNTYTQLLEKINSEQSLDELCKQLVNFARKSSDCARASILVAKDYKEELKKDLGGNKLAFEYKLHTSIGENELHRKSQEALSVEQAAQYLLKELLKNQENHEQAQALPKNAPNHKKLLPAPPGQQQAYRPIWIERTEDLEALPQVLQDYLSLAPMNWASILPLEDDKGRICAILFIEGKKNKDTAQIALTKMQPLIYSGGHALSKNLFWQGRKTLELARKWVNWKDGTINTPKKRLAARIGVPAAISLTILAWPVQWVIKAPAQVRPAEIRQLPAHTNATVVSIPAEEGMDVTKDTLLLQLDTQDLQLQLIQAQSEYLETLAQSDYALEIGDEASMQIARLKSQKALAQVEYLKYQIEQASIRAPFDGLITGPSNLKQKQGEVVQIGEPLIEIAKKGPWEVKVQLREQDLVYLEERLALKGPIDAKLKLTADPTHAHALKLSKKAELSYGLEVSQDNYYFIAVLPLETTPKLDEFLKAGFGGKIGFEIGWRPLGYVLLRDLVRHLKVNYF